MCCVLLYRQSLWPLQFDGFTVIVWLSVWVPYIGSAVNRQPQHWKHIHRHQKYTLWYCQKYNNYTEKGNYRVKTTPLCFHLSFCLSTFSSVIISTWVGCIGFCEPIKCSWQRVKSPTCPPAVGRVSTVLLFKRTTEKLHRCWLASSVGDKM